MSAGLLFAQLMHGGGQGAVLLLVVGQGDAEAEEGGCPFADEDTLAVGAGEVGVAAGSVSQ